MTDLPSLAPAESLLPRRHERNVTTGSLIGLCAVFGYFLVYILIRIGHRNTQGEYHYGDFETFYHAALDVLAGRDPYVPFRPGALQYVYPPMLAVLYTPLTLLPQLAAARFMLVAHIGMVLIALFVAAKLMLRRFGIEPRTPVLLAVCFIAAALAENDLRGQLQALETDILMLLAFVLALHWLDRRPYRSGFALAFALNIKYLSIVFVPYLILRRRWKTLGGMAAWSVALALLPALFLGWRENMRCLKVALGGLLGWVGASTGGQTANVHHLSDLVSISVTSAIARVLRDAGRPESLALGIAAAIGLILLLGAGLLYRAKKLPFMNWPAAKSQQTGPYPGLVALEWVGVMTVMLAFSPNTNTRHLSMTLIHYVAAAVLLMVPLRPADRVPLFAGVAAMFVGFILPFPSMKKTFPEFSHDYFRVGAASWALLLMYATLLYTGVCWVRGRLTAFKTFIPSPSSTPGGEG